MLCEDIATLLFIALMLQQPATGLRLNEKPQTLDREIKTKHMQLSARREWPKQRQSDESMAAGWGNAFKHWDGECVVPPVGKEHEHYCSKSICINHDDRQVPRLFVDLHVDGEGHRVENIMSGLALAHKHGVNFGGVIVGQAQNVSDHHHDIVAITEEVFGSQGKGMLWFGTPPCLDRVIKRADASNASIFAKQGQPRNIYLPAANLQKIEEFLDDKFLEKLRKPLSQKVSLFARDRLSVAIHARRDDLSMSGGLFPAAYYFRIVEGIRKQFPSADVHLWSSTGTYWNTSDLESSFGAQNMTLHIDTDLVEAWAHMSSADIFIGSHSHFSSVPAIMNSNCLIMPEYLVKATKSGLIMNPSSPTEMDSSIKNNLQACLGKPAQSLHAKSTELSKSAGSGNP